MYFTLTARVAFACGGITVESCIVPKVDAFLTKPKKASWKLHLSQFRIIEGVEMTTMLMTTNEGPTQDMVLQASQDEQF